jgi:hypothetical protein
MKIRDVAEMSGGGEFCNILSDVNFDWTHELCFQVLNTLKMNAQNICICMSEGYTENL